MRKVSKVACLGRWLFLAVALVAVIPSAGEAQLGGLKKLKSKVEKAVGGEKAPAEQAAAAPQQRSPYNECTLEVTPEVADCLEKALAAENAELEAFRTWASKVKSQSDYQACQSGIMLTPEGQALAADYSAAMQNQAGLQQAMKTYAEKLKALTEKTCGPEPNTVDDRRREARKQAAEKGRAACNYSDCQYAILKERITPICASGVLDGANGALKLPGEGKDIFWVYSPTEVEAFKARCGRLQSALKKVL